MNSINRLGIRVVILTLIVLGLGYGLWWGAAAIWKASRPVPILTPVPTESPITDRDQDGLSDLVENVYQTNPDVADTDQDGTNDGAEVVAGRNPTQAGPNDKVNDVPLGSDVVDTKTYTGQYLSTLPADLERSEILDKVRLEAFVEKEKGELLPPLPSGLIRTSTDAGKEAITTYLDKISSTTNTEIALISTQDIETAFRTTYASPTNPALKTIREKLEHNVAILSSVVAPAEVKDLHTKLVTATQALATNVGLLASMPADFVGGLIGAKNIELLGPVFEDIASQVQVLETKYGLQ